MVDTHTHTHIAKILIATLWILQSIAGNAQAGEFNILSIQNLPSGHIEYVIEWNNNTITTARALNIGVVVSGTSICVDQALSSLDPYFDDPANGFTVTFSNTGVTILRNPNGSNTFSLATDYAPLLTLLFRAEPGTTSNVSISGFVIESGFSGPAITATSATQTAPSGYNLGGQIIKAQSNIPGWQSCSGSSGIPGVTVSVNPPSGCFAGSSFPNSQLFAQPPYLFFNATSGYSYTITPSKSTGLTSSTDICCGVTSDDITYAHDLLLGLSSGNLAQYLAADFNGNGFATSNDIYYMWQCYNLITPSFSSGWSPWRFVPESSWGTGAPPLEI